MDRSRHIVEALGPEGLRRALRDAFDARSLVPVANACRVSYPGRRPQSVAAATLIEDIAKKALEEPASALALVKALDKACAQDRERTAALDDDAVASVGDGAAPPGRRPGRLLYALASDGRESALTAARGLIARMETAPAPSSQAAAEPAADTAAPGEVPALRERLLRAEEARQESERRAAEESREAEAAAAEALQARKHAHALEAKVQRLTEENARLHDRELFLGGRVEELERGAREAESLGRLSSDVKAALRESQKALHDVRELIQAGLAAPPDPARPYLEALAATVRAVQNEILELRRERESDRRKDREAVTDLARETHSMRSEIAGMRSAPAAERPLRRRGEPERVGLFVDVQNMYYAARQLNARLDFGALIEAVSKDRRLVRAIAYVVQNRDIDQSGFINMLQQRSYEVRRKDLKVRADGSSKGDWDMEMAFEMLDQADGLDVVVLASGDGDFVSLVNRMKMKGPKVEVYSFPGSTAKELIEACDRHVAIDEGLLIRLGTST